MFEYKDLRDEDFMKACRRSVSDLHDEGRTPTTLEIVRRAINSEAPSFYVSYDYARRMLRRYRRNRLSPAIGGEKRMLWHDIDTQVELMKSTHRFATCGQALAAVLTSCTASRFYISEGYALKLFFQIRRRRRRHRRGGVI